MKRSSGRCAPAGRAEPTDSAEGPVTLRADAGRDLYLRLGDRPEVELEVEAVRATLHVEIEADGSGERQRVYDALVAGHRTIRIALDALAGHIARLALRVATPEAGAQIVISGAVLRDALPADPPLLARFAGADGRPPNVVVYVIDTFTGRVKHRIPVGLGPHGVCVFPQPGRYSLGHTGNYR